MKHGIYYAYWEKEWAADYLYYVEKVARLGFDLLEIGAAPLPEYSPEQIKALRDCASANGIQLTAGYGPTYDHNMGSSDAGIRAGALEWYKRLFDVMEQLDIHLIGGALYGYWPVDFGNINKEEDWKRSVEGMKLLAPIAKEHNINLGMEVLNRFESHILNTAEEGVAFVKEVGQENVKVMLDTFHMNIEEESIGDVMRSALPAIFSVTSTPVNVTVWFQEKDAPLGERSEMLSAILNTMELLSWNHLSAWAVRLVAISISGATSAAVHLKQNWMKTQKMQLHSRNIC